MSSLPCVLLSLAITAPMLAQTRQEPAIPTLHATAKLVIVDVVVRDASHHPIHSLKQGDFTLLEDGKPQAIKSFEEFRAETPAVVQPMPKLGPGLYTNISPTPGVGPLNILLFDNQDTQPQNFAVVRQELLKFIDKARPGTRMALFEISDRLILRQGFTDDREQLRQALLKSQPRNVRMNVPKLKLGGEVFNQLGPNDAIQAINAWRNNAEAMREIARYGAGMPGRKNLMWFSGYFPLYFLVQPGDPARCVPCDPAVVKEFRQAADMLAASQVAVYPIDARGLAPEVPHSMDRDEMAAMTGGRAFQEENYMDQITTEAIDDGSNFYTIAYTPNDMRWNGDYRHIKVQVNQPGLELSYRQGFYADDPNVPAKTAASKPGEPMGAEAAAMSRAMNDAMEYGTPNATQIPFLVQVRPASAATETGLAQGNHAPKDVKGPYRRYTVDFNVDPHAIVDKEPGVHHAMVEFVTFVYGADARMVNSSGDGGEGQYSTGCAGRGVKAARAGA